MGVVSGSALEKRRRREIHLKMCKDHKVELIMSCFRVALCEVCSFAFHVAYIRPDAESTFL